ncbi:MAG: DUF4270 family protein [Saprospiraceae bacterium]|nr:DUF4270 family protein [Saprospiraceae bacterium]
MAVNSFITRLGLFIWAIFLVSGCQDPILVGGDFLEDEKLTISNTDKVLITTQTIAGERVTTHNPKLNSKTYILGALEDSKFGKITAELFFKFAMKSTKPAYQDETNPKFDSLVLVLQYDTLGTYGKSFATQSIKLYQLDETISNTDTFYSDKQFKYLSDEIANINKFVSPKDSVRITDHLTGKAVTLAPQLRLKLNDSFGQALFNNASAAKNDTIFNDFFKGVYITSKSPNNESFVYGLNLSDEALIAQAGINKLIMYYTVSDTVKKSYEYNLHTATINKFDHDRSGSLVEKYISNTDASDSITFFQGLGGVKTVVKFSDLAKLDSIIINKAELEFYVADLPGLNDSYAIPPQLIATRKNASGQDIFIDDFAYSFTSASALAIAFGGVPFVEGGKTKYTMNITNHIKKAVKDSTYNADIYLNVLTETGNPKRVVLFGANHSTYPIKLNITYTKK